MSKQAWAKESYSDCLAILHVYRVRRIQLSLSYLSLDLGVGLVS